MQSQTIASFDIGIKNMAYCIFKKESANLGIQSYSIKDWKVLNLINNEDPSENHSTNLQTCTCRKYKETSKLKKKDDALCGKAAKYVLQDQQLFFCKKHANEYTDNEKENVVKSQRQTEKQSQTPPYFIYSSKFSKSALTKMSSEELHEFSNTYFPVGKEQEASKKTKTNKKDMIENLLQQVNAKCLRPIVAAKRVKAGEVDLVSIGRNMATLLDKESEMFSDVTHIIIENQISTLASRMKTIQGMLAQYFILRFPNSKILFVSSMNKLKGLEKLHETTDANASEYKKHKKDGVEYCRRFLEEIHSDKLKWRALLESSKKKDDLADCFLQGVWYIQKEK